MTLKVEYLKETSEEKEKKIYDKLIKNFNEKAESYKSKYRIKIKWGYPHLIKNLFWIFEDYSNQIILLGEENKFVLADEISEDILYEIDCLFQEIPEEIKVKVMEDE